MTRVWTGIVLAALIAGVTGCAAPSSAARQAVMPRPSANARAVDSPELIRRYVEKLPIGSTVTLELASQARFAAVLMAVEPARIIVKPKTRVPKPAREVAFEQIVRIEPAGGGASVARAAAVGAATGAGVFLGFFLWLLSSID